MAHLSTACGRCLEDTKGIPQQMLQYALLQRTKTTFAAIVRMFVNGIATLESIKPRIVR